MIARHLENLWHDVRLVLACDPADYRGDAAINCRVAERSNMPLDRDTGRPLRPCVDAHVTATFVARKLGFDQSGAERYTGTVHVADIGVPRKLRRELGLT